MPPAFPAYRPNSPVDREQVVRFQHADEGQVERVVEVEEPLHERIELRIAAALAVVQHQDRDRQHHGQLQRGVQRFVWQERVPEDAYVEYQPQRLFPQAAAIGPEAQHQQRRHTAPVAGETHHADQADQERLRPAAFDLLAVGHAQHHQAPRQRPDHACLAAVVVVVVRDELMPAAEPVPFDLEREVGDDREEEHPHRVFVHVSRVEEPLGHEKTHRRHGDAPDDVHRDREPLVRVAGEDRPRDVVDGHGDDRDELDRVAVQYLIIRHDCGFLLLPYRISCGFTPPITPPITPPKFRS